MSKLLEYTIANAHLVDLAVEVDVGGTPATAITQRFVVEALPTDPAGKTLTAALPVDAAGDFAPGDVISITVNTAAETDALKAGAAAPASPSA